jgi:hypothetical protein
MGKTRVVFASGQTQHRETSATCGIASKISIRQKEEELDGGEIK